MADLQRDRESGTVVLEQINTVHQRSPDPSDSAANSMRVLEVLPQLARVAKAAALTKKKLITNCAKKKKKKHNGTCPICNY